MAKVERPQTRHERRRQQRLGQQRRQNRARQRQRQRGSVGQRYVVGGIAVLGLITILGLGGYAVFARNTAADAAGGSIDGIPCQSNEVVTYHVHAHLALYQDGRPVEVPRYVGIPVHPQIPANTNGQNTCLYWLHTHDTTGVVHVESPTARTYTLGQFFDIWRHTSRWDSQGGLGVVVNSAFVQALDRAKPSAIHAFVDGHPFRSSYRNVPLTSHTTITLELGNRVAPPAAHYAFAKGD